MEIVFQIIIGGVAGWIAEKIMKFDTGLIMNIVLGIVGAVLVNFLLANVFKMDAYGGWLGQFGSALVGACVLILIYRAVKGRG
jgi:uncharacterized membrane protein YeaQ/YmgE (transglycosylase-associated protein family)